MKIRIYRREFNPEKKDSPNPKQLVATFQSGMELEANVTMSMLMQKAASFLPDKEDRRFAKYRYTLIEDLPPITPAASAEGIQVDTSTATPTHRPIAFSLAWSIKHDLCEIIAHHEQYGAVRATIEDSPAARQLFVRRLASIWPNAKQKK